MLLMLIVNNSIANEGLGYPRFDSQLATTSLLVLRSVKDTPGWGKDRRRTKRGKR